MAGVGPVATGGLMAAESLVCPSFCRAADALPISKWIAGGGGDMGPRETRPRGLSPQLGVPRLSSTFVGGRGSVARPRTTQRRRRGLVVVGELGGQYEEGFEDVHLQLVNYFTYKAMRTVLHQLYEMNPPKYMWFYNFVATNKTDDGKRFLRILAKEKQDLAERVMITRLHLYGKWIKKCDHAKMYQRIADENLELMRERLKETVIWPSDDMNTEKIG